MVMIIMMMMMSSVDEERNLSVVTDTFSSRVNNVNPL